MALITDLPSNASPSTSDYMITDTGSATQKCTIANLKKAMGLPSGVAVVNDTSLQSSEVRTYTFASSSRGFFWFNGAGSTGAQGFYLFNITTQGGITVREIAAASFVTVTTASNQIIFTKSSLNTAVYPSFLLTTGSITSVTSSAT